MVIIYAAVLCTLQEANFGHKCKLTVLTYGYGTPSTFSCLLWLCESVVIVVDSVIVLLVGWRLLVGIRDIL